MTNLKSVFIKSSDVLFLLKNKKKQQQQPNQWWIQRGIMTPNSWPSQEKLWELLSSWLSVAPKYVFRNSKNEKMFREGAVQGALIPPRPFP